MRKRSRKPARPKDEARTRDANRLAFDTVQHVIDQFEGGSPLTPDGKDALAVVLGRRGGLKGGPARAAKMTKEELRQSAIKAAQARWRNRQKA